MGTTHLSELERFRQFIDEKLHKGETSLSPEQTLELFRQHEEEIEIDEEIPYDPIPPNQRMTVEVEIRSKERGQPLYYPIDEEDLELEDIE